MVIGIEAGRGPVGPSARRGRLPGVCRQSARCDPLPPPGVGNQFDAANAKLLADLVRTNRHNHRSIAGETPDVESVKARAHKNFRHTRNIL